MISSSEPAFLTNESFQYDPQTQLPVNEIKKEKKKRVKPFKPTHPAVCKLEGGTLNATMRCV